MINGVDCIGLGLLLVNPNVPHTPVNREASIALGAIRHPVQHLGEAKLPNFKISVFMHRVIKYRCCQIADTSAAFPSAQLERVTKPPEKS